MPISKFITFELFSPVLRTKFLLLTLSWIANFMAYFGLTLNFQNFHGNSFINFFLLTIVKLPSAFVAWYLMDTRLGRRWSNCSALLLGGFCLSIPVILPSSWSYSTVLFSLIGKFATTISFNVMYQQAAELYPTLLRHQGIGLNSAIASFVYLGLPYLAHMVSLWVRSNLLNLIN